LKTLITQNNHPPFLKAKLNEEIPKNSNRETYLRGFAKFNAIGQLEVTPMPKQDSSLLMPFVKSNVLIRLKPDEKLRKKHELVDVLPLETGPSLHE
jgi:molybdopterin molybdotransferase